MEIRSLRRVTLILSLFLITATVALTFFSYEDSFAATSRFPASKPVFAFYYGWYTPNAWYGGVKGLTSLAVADVPAIGLYDSQNISVIDTQISEALSAGINGFIASWWGPGSFTDNTDQILLNQTASKFQDFSLTLYFETSIIQNSTLSNQSTQIEKDVTYIMQTYGNNVAFTHINGRPVLFMSGADNWPVSFWSGVTNAIHAANPTLLVLSDSLNIAYMSAFDGAASYVDLGYMTQNLTLVNGTYPTFTDISKLAKSEGKYWFATASPGFN